MDILQAVKERRSIREFQNRDVPEDIVNKLIEALIWAPSAGNLQSRKFYFVKDSSLKRRLAVAALNQRFIAEAPLVVVGCADTSISRSYGERGKTLYSVQDVACSIMGMMLAAHADGIGSVWVGAFNEAEVSEVMDLKPDLRPVVIVPLGYPARIPGAPRRVSREEAVEFR